MNIINNNGCIRIMSEGFIEKSLEPNTYTVGHDLQGFYLEKVNALNNNSDKIYGKTQQYADRIINTFQERKKNTGVLLSGEKGSGKTLLARLTSQKALEKNIPVLLINEPFHGEEFNTFIQLIDQPCVLFFDEYEKTYHEEALRNQLLTLMDGVYSSEKLFLLTSNEIFVSRYMENRPGRIFYSIEFSGVEESIITEYLIDNLEDQSQLDSIVSAAKIINDFNFDMLAALTEELNRYGGTVKEAIELLNISNSNTRSSSNFKVLKVVNCDGQEIPKSEIIDRTITVNPFIFHSSITYISDRDSDGDELYGEIYFKNDDLKDADISAGRYTYVNDRNETVIIEKEYFAKSIGWEDYL